MTVRWRNLSRRWRGVALVVLPGSLLILLWISLTSGEMAAWRMARGTGLPLEQFDPIWKLGFLVEHPLHFPRMLLASLPRQAGTLWQQLIGVLGWLDAPLRPWFYPVLRSEEHTSEIKSLMRLS